MTYHASLKTACLAAILCLSVSTAVVAAGASKADDPAFVVPKVANPIPAEEIKELQIVEDQGRWLVSDKTLEQYGIYKADANKGTYWFRLPSAKNGQTQWSADPVALELPGKAVKGGRTINIRYVRRPMGISYVLGEGQNQLLPPDKATRMAPVLKDLAEPITISKGNKDGGGKNGIVGLSLFWDPLMDAKTDIEPIKTKKAVMSPCAFRLSTKGVELRNPDFAMLAGAYHDQGYAMWPLIDNNFNPDETHAILANTALQDHMIKELLGYALLYQFKGYNIDFENVNYSDKNKLTSFVKRMADAFHAYGLTVSMDVTPPSDSPNWSMVYDRKALASALDYLVIMAYDQTGRTSSVAGPVASYPWVEQAVQNTLSMVPADKIVLGMPLYTRIWYESKNGKNLTLSPEQWPVINTAAGQTGIAARQTAVVAAAPKGASKLFVKTLTMADSEAIMTKYKDNLVWNDGLKLYYLEVPLTGGLVKIWFEDEQSLKEKVQLISLYHLKGASFWRKGFETKQFWQRFAKHELT